MKLKGRNPMPSYSTYAGEAVYGSRRFKPKGKMIVVEEGAMPNPASRLGGGGFSARIFVGLNVSTRKGYTVDDVVDLVWKVRKRQKRTADASILAQKGIYEDFKGRRIVEPSVQIIIIDLSGESKRTFIGEMKELAEELCTKLRQETVILEIQKRGVVTDVYSVTQ
jgi:hypothetical protein